MKKFFKTRGVRVLCVLLSLMLLGMIVAAANGQGETAQSTIIGTIFSPIQKAAVAISRQIDKTFGNASGRSSYEKEIESLKGQISDLEGNLVDYENVKRQNELYKEFLELKQEKSQYSFEECSIIARDSTDLFYSFTLNKGTSQNIKVNDSVVYGKYLVGVVTKAYPTYSVVQTVLDKDFNAACYEIVSKETGYVSGTYDLAKSGLTGLRALSSTTAVTEGSIICTSGIGGIFPADLIIGRVTEVKSEGTDISSYAIIKPHFDIRQLDDVFVITSTGEGDTNE